MSLSILSIAYPFAPVVSSSAGGAEQILRLVEAALVARGHRSAVVAHAHSEVAGSLIPTPVPDTVLSELIRGTVVAAHQRSIDRALHGEHFDLIHMHGIDFDRYQLPTGVPVVVTLHLPPSWYAQRIWTLPENVHFVCVSESQRSAARLLTARPLALLPNGVPAAPPRDAPGARGYALMLSRICPEKNLHTGFDAAQRAGVPAILAGQAFPYPDHLRYLHQEIHHRLGPRAHLLPPAGGAEKTKLLAGARCLLLPSLAPETSSLVAMEALHAGVPVIAFPSGALPEIVEHGRAGFLVRSADEMAAAIGRAEEIEPTVCRAVATERFSLSRMVDGYTALFERVLSALSLHAAPPPRLRPPETDALFPAGRR